VGITAELRPLSLGEVLDRTFTLYRSHFRLFIGIMVPAQVLFTAASLLFQVFLTPARLAAMTPPIGPNPPPGLVFAALGIMILYQLPLAVFSILVYAVANGATTAAVSEVYLGKNPSILGAYRSLRGRVGKVIALVFAVTVGVLAVWLWPILLAWLIVRLSGGAGNMLVLGVALLVAMLFLLGTTALAVWFALRYSVAIPALVLEKLGAWSSMRRSARLTVGHRGRLFMVWLLMAVIRYAGIMLFQGPFVAAALILYRYRMAPLWFRTFSTVAAGMGGMLTGPFLLIGLSLMYYDIRVRKEAFDLELMLQGTAAAGPAGATPVVPAS